MSVFSINGAAGTSVADAEADVASRQLNVALAALESETSCSAAITSLRASCLLGRLASLASENAEQALRRCSNKATALLSSQHKRSQALEAGFSLALILAEQVPDGDDAPLFSHAQEWIAAALNYLATASGKGGQPSERVLAPLLQLLTGYVYAAPAAARPEFARAMITPNLPKTATLITACLESASKADVRNDELISILLSAIVNMINRHPSICRPLAPRLHAIAVQLALCTPDAPQSLISDATQLLGTLHLTGAQTNTAKSKELAGSVNANKATQAQLWSATVTAAIGSASQAWEACTSTLDNPSPWTARHPKLPFEELSEDEYEATPVAIARLTRLLGDAEGTQRGILLHLLQLRTQRAVALPLRSLFSLATNMLAATEAKAPEKAVDAALHATQAMHLPLLHIQALKLLAVSLHLTRAAGVTATSRFASPALQALAAFLERGEKVSPAVRACAFRVFAIACTLPLDPVSRTTLRACRLCLAPISALLVAQDSTVGMPSSKSGDHTATPRRKRGRQYESDAINATPFVKVLGYKSQDEQASALSCFEALPHLFAAMLTAASPVHYDLGHTAAQLIVVIAEITTRQVAQSSSSDTALAAGSLQCLAGMIKASSGGPMLALLAPRAANVAEAVAYAGEVNAAVSAAARDTMQAVRDAVIPRLPPVLSGHIDEGDDDDDETWAQQHWGADPVTGQTVKSVTGTPLSITGDRGSRMVSAMDSVLGVKMDTPQRQSHDPIPGPLSPQTAPKGPRHSSPARTENASMAAKEPAADLDPVKPMQRPMSPKIGSPPAKPAKPASAAGSPDAKEVFGGTRAASTTGRAPQNLTSTLGEREDAQEHLTTPPIPATSVIDSVSSRALATSAAEEVASDDEEMPQIDIESSDDDS